MNKLAGLPHTFADKNLLKTALQPRSKRGQELEWLGDRALNLALANLLFQTDKQRPLEQIVRAHSVLSSNQHLSVIGKQLKLTGHENAAANHKLLADGVEALIGAVFLDAGAEVVAKCVNQLFAKACDENASIWQRDPKSELKELCEGRKLAAPQYKVGKQGDKFQAKCSVGKLAGTGLGHNSVAAQQAAAAEILKEIYA